MRWVEVHARLLDRSRSAQALTPSQTGAAATIVSALNGGTPYLNLWGPPGVGKTFLGRHLVLGYQGIYLSSPDQPLAESPTGKWVCVDNVAATRYTARAIYSKLVWQRATAVLVITQSAVTDSLLRVQLQLTADDLNAVCNILLTLYRDLNLPALDANAASLWTHIRACTSISQSSSTKPG
jgi:hypothetical protein